LHKKNAARFRAHRRRAVRHDGSKSADELLQARDLLCAPSATTPIGTAFLAEYMPRISAPIPGAISFAPRPSLTGRLPARSSPVSNFWTTTPTAPTSLLFTSPESQVLLKPTDGGTIAALDFSPAAATLVNSILRRPEAYHTRLREAAGKPATAPSRASRTDPREEPGLERYLRYDAGLATPSAS